MTLLQTSGRLDEQSAWLASLRAQQVTFTLSITVADVQRLGLHDIYTTLRAPLKAFIVASNGPSRAFLLKKIKIPADFPTVQRVGSFCLRIFDHSLRLDVGLT